MWFWKKTETIQQEIFPQNNTAGRFRDQKSVQIKKVIFIHYPKIIWNLKK